MMRVIFDPVRDGLSAINTANEQLQRAQQQVATGKRLQGASDDPNAAQQAVIERATIGKVDAYTRTSDSAAARLSTADAVLNGFGDKLTAAIVAGQSARGSEISASARSAAAEQIRGLRESLLTDINTQFNGASLFAGAATNQQTYIQVAGVWTYQGDSSAVRVDIDNGRSVAITFDGRAIAQGSDAINVFTALDNLAAAVEAGDSDAIGTALDAVERTFDRTQRALGALGADERGIDEAATGRGVRRQGADIRRSSLEDANLAEAVTRLAQADNAYRAALGAVSTAERQSLLDYLR
jgi:flagellar hook-associated protein 3 FlgL